jgi:hypothetical protein
MKIRIIGGGPAGLYFAALMKRENPAHDVVVFERGPRDATWGFGVVFSDRALEFLRADDEAMYQLLTPLMETWPNLTIVHNDTPHAHHRQRLCRHRAAGTAEPALCPGRVAGRQDRIRQRGDLAGSMPRAGRCRPGGRRQRRLFLGAQRERGQVRHRNRPAQQPLHLVRHQQGLRQPVADFPQHRTRRVLRPSLPLQPAHEHLPGRGHRCHLAAAPVSRT